MVEKSTRHHSKRKVPLALKAMRLAFHYLGPLFPGLFSAWAYRLWFSTRRFKRPPHEQAAWNQARRNQIMINGESVAVYHWPHPDRPDTARQVLLIHGWNGRGTQLAPMLKPLHEAGYSVLALDLPGHGDSDEDSTNVFKAAQGVREVITACGPVVAVITHSFGLPCLLVARAQRAALERPLQAVVAIAPPSDARGLIDKFAQLLDIPARVIQRVKRRLHDEFGEDIAERLAFYRLAREMSTPALVIHDADDHDVSVEEGRKIAACWPAARFVQTRLLGHRRILKDPEVIEQTIAFIECHCRS